MALFAALPVACNHAGPASNTATASPTTTTAHSTRNGPFRMIWTVCSSTGRTAKTVRMRADVDALVARAYGLTVDELRFVFTDFTENAVSPAYRRQVLEEFEGL